MKYGVNFRGATWHDIAVIPKKMQLFDLLEAVKHLKGEGGHGQNCTIWDNNPSSDPLQAFFKQNIKLNTE